MNLMNFEKIKDAVKLKFLKELLEKNAELKNQFIEYIQSAESNTSYNREAIMEMINETATEMKIELESLDFEVDWEDYAPRHSGYIPEYEAQEHHAEDLVEEITEPLQDNTEILLNNGKIYEAMTLIIGSFEAFHKAEINDEYDSLGGDPNSYLLDRHTEVLKNIMPELKKTVMPAGTVKAILDICFEYNNVKFKNEAVFIEHFQSFLINLVDSKDSATYALSLLNKFNIEPVSCPELTVHLHSYDENSSQWLENAESLVLTSSLIAQQLLEFYVDKNDHDNFIRVAKNVINPFKYELRDYIIDNIEKTKDIEFYKSLLAEKAIDDSDILIYKELRKYLSDNEKNNFFRKISYNDELKMQTLEVEGKFAEILDFIQKKQDTYHFEAIIKMISVHYPAECFNLIKTKIERLLRTAHDRHTYGKIANLLKITRTLTGISEKTEELIAHTYNHKPNKPALKDEMRKAGVTP